MHFFGTVSRWWRRRSENAKRRKESLSPPPLFWGRKREWWVQFQFPVKKICHAFLVLIGFDFIWYFQKVRSSGSYPDLLEMVTRSSSPGPREQMGVYAKVRQKAVVMNNLSQKSQLAGWPESKEVSTEQRCKHYRVKRVGVPGGGESGECGRREERYSWLLHQVIHIFPFSPFLSFLVLQYNMTK